MKKKFVDEIREAEREGIEALIAEVKRLSPGMVSELKTLVSKADPNAPYLSNPLADNAFESAFLRIIIPKDYAWVRATELIREIASDPAVMTNQNTVDFLEMVATLAGFAQGRDDLNKVLKPLVASVKSDIAKEVRNKRTSSGSALVQKKALELYDARTWKSVAAAARGIFKELQSYAESLKNPQRLSEERFEKTLREWIKQRNK